MTDKDRYLQTTLGQSVHAAESIARQGDVVDGKYAIRNKLGAGGMATVFLATDLRLKREVAIKIAHPELADEPESCARFLREAELMAKLRHPNVLEIYDIGTWRDFPYLVMPYLRGNDLETWCHPRGEGPLDVDVAIGILDQVLTGLAAMHALGLVHRDVKPRNILVSDELKVTTSTRTPGSPSRAARRGTWRRRSSCTAACARSSRRRPTSMARASPPTGC